MAEYAETQAKAAKALGASRSAFVDWANDPTFPKKTKTRGYNLTKIRAWTKKNGRGEHRKSGGGKSTTNADGLTQAEANIALTIERTATERIRKEDMLVDQQIKLKGILLADDVSKLYEQTRSTVAAVMDSLLDVVDRAMPEKTPSAAAYKEVRRRVMDAVRKAPEHTAAAMEELE